MSDINSPATPTAQDSPASARLEAGLTAPNFTLPSDNGDSITLSALRGQNIVLYFYPAAMTPGCTTEACDFRDNNWQRPLPFCLRILPAIFNTAER